MAGRKRAAADHAAADTRPAKAAKMASKNGAKKNSSPTSKGSAKPAAKTTVPSPATFKEHALPLHVHVTHTPPTIAEPGSAEDNTPALSGDPGHIASITLSPSVFSTGTLGWKGSKRVAVELMNDDGKKEKVMVMMTINASVLGSKPAATKPEGKKTRSRAKKADTEDEHEEETEEDED